MWKEFYVYFSDSIIIFKGHKDKFKFEFYENSLHMCRHLPTNSVVSRLKYIS